MFLFEEILPAEPSEKFAKLGHFLVVVADYHSDEVDTSRVRLPRQLLCLPCELQQQYLKRSLRLHVESGHGNMHEGDTPTVGLGGMRLS